MSTEPLDPARLAEIRQEVESGEIESKATGDFGAYLASRLAASEEMKQAYIKARFRHAAYELLTEVDRLTNALAVELSNVENVTAKLVTERARVERVEALVSDGQVIGAEWVTIRSLRGALAGDTEGKS